MKKIDLWIALSLANRIGTRTLTALFDHFHDDPQAVLAASPADLQQVPGIGPKIAAEIQRVNLEHFAERMQTWKNNYQLSVTTFINPGHSYPPSLYRLPDPPATLFMYRQFISPLRLEPAIAIVGTRKPTPESKQLAHHLSQACAAQGITVVSGLALGIDTAAHEAALGLPGGQTIAVLGSGFQDIYPPENADLAKRCTLILSEVAPDASPNRARLVARNRIISGLSKALVVVETSSEGGAMHAARFAQQQQRPVFAVENRASGNQELLRQGAQVLKPDIANLAQLLQVVLM